MPVALKPLTKSFLSILGHLQIFCPSEPDLALEVLETPLYELTPRLDCFVSIQIRWIAMKFSMDGKNKHLRVGLDGLCWAEDTQSLYYFRDINLKPHL